MLYLPSTKCIIIINNNIMAPRAQWPRLLANQRLWVNADGTHTCVACGKMFQPSSRSNAYKHVKKCAPTATTAATIPVGAAAADTCENEGYRHILDRAAASPRAHSNSPLQNHPSNQQSPRHQAARPARTAASKQRLQRVLWRCLKDYRSTRIE